MTHLLGWLASLRARRARPARDRRRTVPVRPEVEGLEQRCVPSATGPAHAHLVFLGDSITASYAWTDRGAASWNASIAPWGRPTWPSAATRRPRCSPRSP